LVVCGTIADCDGYDAIEEETAEESPGAARPKTPIIMVCRRADG
jgi:hypothetical protein